MVLLLALAAAAVAMLAPPLIRSPVQPGLELTQASGTTLLHAPRGPSRAARGGEAVPPEALIEVVSGAAILRSDLPAVVSAGPEALFRYSLIPSSEGGPAQRFTVLPDGAPLRIEAGGRRLSLLDGAIATLYMDGHATIDRGTALLVPGGLLKVGDSFTWLAPPAPLPALPPPPAQRSVPKKAVPLAAAPWTAVRTAPALRDALAARVPPPQRPSPAIVPPPAAVPAAPTLPPRSRRGLFAAAGLATLLGVVLELRLRRG